MKKKMSKIGQTGFTKKDLVVIAILYLGGTLHLIHTEDIAIKAAGLAPRRFAWEKYPDYINLESVRITLKNEMMDENSRVVGSVKEGWMLSREGMNWCMDKGLLTSHPEVKIAIMDEINRLKKTRAFEKFEVGKGKEISESDVENFFRIDRYFSDRNKRERLTAVINVSIIASELQALVEGLVHRVLPALEVNK